MLTPLAEVLGAYLECAQRSYEQVAQLSGVPKRTIANWADGTVRRPQQWQPLLQIAVALHLNEEDASRLLQAANHPPIHELRNKDTNAGGKQLLANWQTSATQRSAPIHNLPAAMASLVGRQRELEQMCAFLQRQDVRLITVTGAPGVGKTRLAVQVAESALSYFGDGVWFVRLAPLQDHAQVLSAIAATLGVREERDSLFHALVAHLQPRETLLLLDNFEHVSEAAVAISELLAACQRLKALVTSRELLRLYGEHEFPLAPLAIPAVRPLPSPFDLVRYAAVDLFVQRAQAVQPDFVLTARNAASVAEICARLDGLPLAIELAAARIKQFEPSVLNAQLAEQIRLLSRHLRDVSPRHRSLHSALAWSYHLLNHKEQNLLRRLTVFAEGCTLAALEAVYDIPRASGSVAQLLRSLVDKNLVQKEEDGEGTERFTLLETIRIYGLAQLEAQNEATDGRQRHALYFLSLTEQAAIAYFKAEEGLWLERLARDYANLRAALRWIVRTEQTALGLRLGQALNRFWYARGLYREGQTWLEQILELPGVEQEKPAWAAALNSAGVMAASRGDYAESAALFQSGLDVAREIGDPRRTADALRGLGFALYVQGNYREARRLIEEALAIRRPIGDKFKIADALHCLAVVTRQSGDYASARAFIEEELPIFRAMGNRIGLITARENLAHIEREEGNYAAARTLLEQNLAESKANQHRYGVANALLSLGHIFYLEGKHDRARALYEQSVALNEELGNKLGRADGMRYLGILDWAAGNWDKAYVRLKEDLLLRQTESHKLGIVLALTAFVAMATSLGQPRPALQIAGAVATFQKEISLRTLPRIEKDVLNAGIAQAKARIAADDAIAAWAEGMAMSFESAIARAIAMPIESSTHHTPMASSTSRQK